MEDKAILLESLFEKVKEYSKTSYELFKLKTVDKTAEIIALLVPRTILFFFLSLFLFFLNLGLAIWLGEILGEIYYGFFVVAGFYCFVGLFVHVFMRRWLKKKVSDSIIKHLLN